jgi:hypothetical protein
MGTFIYIAVEDDLSEAVVRRNLAQTRRLVMSLSGGMSEVALLS